MRIQNFKLFDEVVPTGTSSSTTAVFTDAAFNEQLAKHDQLAIHVIVDDIAGTPAANGNFYLFVEHSSDGRDWLERDSQSNAYLPANANVNITLNGSTNPPVTTFAQQMWSEAAQATSITRMTASTGPFLAMTRLRMFFSDPGMSARVEVHITQRDG